MIRKWVEAFNSGNAANVTSLYRADSMLLPTLDKSLLLSRPLIHAYLENLIERQGAVVCLHDYTRRGNTEAGFYTFELGNGDKIAARFTMTVKGGKIAAHHSSIIP
jgi:hypothetical protein|tara:strand:- start:1956 stop:2273 length:318 start_codon:yes stop_codon:yes gene_type:complete